MKTSTFWPQGNEIYLLFLLIPCIGLSGYIAYDRVTDKINEECQLPSTFSSAQFDFSDALIPCSQIYHGGPPKDGIPSLTNPQFIESAQVDFLDDDDRLIAVSADGEIKAYPLRIMARHECVNDSIGDTNVAVTYCPLCDSAVVFNRAVGNEVLEFGISGLLYQSNVLLYDRQGSASEESLWSQLLGLAVVGPKKGTVLKPVPHQVITWSYIKDQVPQAKVLSDQTGYLRDYPKNFYLEYFSQPNLMFPVNHYNQTFDPKEPIIGVIAGDNEVKAYPVKRISSETTQIRDQVGGKDLAIHFIHDQAPIIEHDIDLRVIHTFWFAWYTFYPATRIYEGDGFNLAVWNQTRTAKMDQ